jgi:hypothetical protein
MSTALTPTFIKRGILIALLAGLMFAAGFATRDADAQPGSMFIACVNKYTGVMRMSNVEPEFRSQPSVNEPLPSDEVDVCQPHEEAWELIAFPFEESFRPLDR